MRNYPEYIMKSLRQRRGLEPNDTSDDDYIRHMEPDRAFSEICRWNGLPGDWCEVIKSWYEGVYEAEEVEYKKPVFDPYDIAF